MELNQKEFELLREYIKSNYGINMGDEKKTLVYSRLRSLLKKLNFDDFASYYQYLINDKSGEAAAVFINKITTNHTFFMRESEHFEYLTQTVLPWVEKKFANTKDLRLWCAACSSGEEAYTLQMVVQEYFTTKSGWNLEILATDISEKVLQQASVGIYSKDSVQTLPKEWYNKYFKVYDEDNVIVSDSLKKHITFRKFNLMQQSMPFKKPMQVIFCRNVMIYFDATTREALVNRLYSIIESDGYFFIGHSESLSNINTKFNYIKPAIYKK